MNKELKFYADLWNSFQSSWLGNVILGILGFTLGIIPSCVVLYGGWYMAHTWVHWNTFWNVVLGIVTVYFAYAVFVIWGSVLGIFD